MPIYEYRCSRCGHELEMLQKLGEVPLTTCPSCQAQALVKKVSAAGFQLKGSGWYATDFRNSGAKPDPVAKPDAPKTEGGKGGEATPAASESKSESKSDAKGAPAPSAAPSSAGTEGASGA